MISEQGSKSQRAKHGARAYYKGRYHIAFYKERDDGDESLYMGFDNVAEICRYLGWGTDPKSMKRVYLTLYKCLYGEDTPHTKLIDGVKLRPYLIDMSEEIEEDERREKFMKKFVKISSSITIEVYPDLNAIDTTNKAAAMADKLSSKPNWVFPVLIKSGVHYYPAEVRTWKAVKALEKHQKLTVSEPTDDITPEELEMCQKILKTVERFSARKKPEAQKAEEKAEEKMAEETIEEEELELEEPAPAEKPKRTRSSSKKESE